MSIRELEEFGWTTYSGVTSDADLHDLANDLGNPIALSDGTYLKRLEIRKPQQARTGTFGKKFGEGAYPLHTDTAHWPRPARLIVLRAAGDLRRPTVIHPFKRLFTHADDIVRESLGKSVWYSGTTSRRFCCSIRFKCDGHIGCRYDPICMKPANNSAAIIKQYLDSASSLSEAQPFQWKKGTALVLSNWHVLHGRGNRPEAELSRQISRIYVE